MRPHQHAQPSGVATLTREQASSSRRFRRYVAAALAMSTGYCAQDVAVAVLAYDLTGSAAILGLAAGARFAPMLVLSRRSARLIKAVGNKARISAIAETIVVGLNLSFWALAATGQARPWTVVAFALLTGVCFSVDLPARMTLVGELVDPPRLAKASSLTTAAFMLGRVCGPSLAAIVIAFLSPSAVLIFTAVLVSLAATVFAGLARQFTAVQGRSHHNAPPAVGEPPTRTGIVAALRHRPQGTVIALALAVTACAVSSDPALLVLARDSLDLEGAYAPLLAVMAAGAIVGAILVGRWQAPAGARLAWLTLAVGGALVTLGHATSLGPAVAICLWGGVAAGAFTAAADAHLRLTSPPSQVDTLVAAYWAILTGTAAVGAPCVGALTAAVGARVAFAILGASLVLASAAARWHLTGSQRPALVPIGREDGLVQ